MLERNSFGISGRHSNLRCQPYLANVKRIRKNTLLKLKVNSAETLPLFVNYLTNPAISNVLYSVIGCVAGAYISQHHSKLLKLDETENVSWDSNKQTKFGDVENQKLQNFEGQSHVLKSSLITLGHKNFDSQFQNLPSAQQLWDQAKNGVRIKEQDEKSNSKPNSDQIQNLNQQNLNVLRTPHLYLQAFQKQYRSQILEMAFQQLKQHVDQLPGELQNSSFEQFNSLMEVIILSCGYNISNQILGYVPSTLDQKIKILQSQSNFFDQIHNQCQLFQNENNKNNHNNSIVKDQILEESQSSQNDIQKLTFQSLLIQQNETQKNQPNNSLFKIVQQDRQKLYIGIILYLRYGKIQNDINSRTTGQGELVINVIQQGSKIIQDLVITLSEIVANAYILDIRKGDHPNINALGQPLGLLPKLANTRQLERFRNAIALQAWLNYNYFSVEAIFEDRFQIFQFATDGTILGSSISCRRSVELNNLKGWRLFVSLFLEFVDLFGPVVRGMVSKAGDLVSWLLVQFIGRSLGLIYKGIVQSLRGEGKKKREGEGENQGSGFNFVFQ